MRPEDMIGSEERKMGREVKHKKGSFPSGVQL